MHTGVVISVGEDAQLLFLREAVLQRAGFRVLSTAEVDIAISYLESGNCGALLMCYSMPLQERQRLARRFRALCPRGCIIAITNAPQARPPVDADAFIYGIEGAEALIDIIRSHKGKAA
jgi:DNA-binding response OmpR family regulator